MAFKKYLKSKSYKERAQPSGRQHLGFLEKKKDWLKRARDFKTKQKELGRLKKEARTRNKDEFMFGMEKVKGAGDSKVIDLRNPFTVDELTELRGQDMGYLRNLMREEDKRIEELRSTLHMFAQDKSFSFDIDKKESLKPQRLSSDSNKDEDKKKSKKVKIPSNDFSLENLNEVLSFKNPGPKNLKEDSKSIEITKKNKKERQVVPKARHIIFVDDDEEAESFNAAEYFDTLPELVSRRYNRLRSGDLEKVEIKESALENVNELEKEKVASYRELKTRILRRKKLSQMIDELQLKVNLTKKGRRFKVGENDDGTGAIYEWKYERKK